MQTKVYLDETNNFLSGPELIGADPGEIERIEILPETAQICAEWHALLAQNSIINHHPALIRGNSPRLCVRKGSPPWFLPGFFSMATTLKLFRTMVLLKVARGVDFQGERSDGNSCLKMKVP